MPHIFYQCDECANGGDGTCYPHEDLRLMPNGDWVCDSCFADMAPQDLKAYGVEIKDEDDPTRWNDYPAIPVYGPITPNP